MSRQASGLKAWVVQRVTAVYLALFGVYMVFRFAVSPPADFETWRLWLATPVISVAVLLFFFALLLHAWVGIRDVLIDYVPLLPARVVLLALFAVGLVAAGLWVAQVVILTRVTG